MLSTVCLARVPADTLIRRQDSSAARGAGSACGGLLFAGVVGPGRAVAHAVGDEVLACVGHLAGDEIGDEQVPGAGAALVGRVEQPVVACAVPATFDGRGMQAGPAGDGRGVLAVAEPVVVAEPALEPGGIPADPFGRVLGEDDPPCLLQQAFARVGVGRDALDVQRVRGRMPAKDHRPGRGRGREGGRKEHGKESQKKSPENGKGRLVGGLDHLDWRTLRLRSSNSHQLHG